MNSPSIEKLKHQISIDSDYDAIDDILEMSQLPGKAKTLNDSIVMNHLIHLCYVTIPNTRQKVMNVFQNMSQIREINHIFFEWGIISLLLCIAIEESKTPFYREIVPKIISNISFDAYRDDKQFDTIARYLFSILDDQSLIIQENVILAISNIISLETNAQLLVDINITPLFPYISSPYVNLREIVAAVVMRLTCSSVLQSKLLSLNIISMLIREIKKGGGLSAYHNKYGVRYKLEYYVVSIYNLCNHTFDQFFEYDIINILIVLLKSNDIYDKEYSTILLLQLSSFELNKPRIGLDIIAQLVTCLQLNTSTPLMNENIAAIVNNMVYVLNDNQKLIQMGIVPQLLWISVDGSAIAKRHVSETLKILQSSAEDLKGNPSPGAKSGSVDSSGGGEGQSSIRYRSRVVSISMTGDTIVHQQQLSSSTSASPTSSSSISSMLSSSCFMWDFKTVGDNDPDGYGYVVSPSRVVDNSNRSSSNLPASMQGWAVKQGHIFPTWRRRFFVLVSDESSTVLKYYYCQRDHNDLIEGDENDGHSTSTFILKGCIHIYPMSIVTLLDSTTLYIYNTHQKQKDLKMQFLNANDAQKWCDSIRQHIFYRENIA